MGHTGEVGVATVEEALVDDASVHMDQLAAFGVLESGDFGSGIPPVFANPAVGDGVKVVLVDGYALSSLFGGVSSEKGDFWGALWCFLRVCLLSDGAGKEEEDGGHFRWDFDLVWPLTPVSRGRCGGVFAVVQGWDVRGRLLRRFRGSTFRLCRSRS